MKNGKPLYLLFALIMASGCAFVTAYLIYRRPRAPTPARHLVATILPTPTPTETPAPAKRAPTVRKLQALAVAAPTGVHAQANGTIQSWSGGVVTLNTGESWSDVFADSDTSATIGRQVSIVYDVGDRHIVYIYFPDNFIPFGLAPTPTP